MGVSGSRLCSDSTVCSDRSIGSVTPTMMASGFSSPAVVTASMPNPHSPANVSPDAFTTCFASYRAWMSVSTISVDGVFATRPPAFAL